MLTNVAIVVMRLVGLAPASVEQCNTCRHASRVDRLVALGNLHQGLGLALATASASDGGGKGLPKNLAHLPDIPI